MDLKDFTCVSLIKFDLDVKEKLEAIRKVVSFFGDEYVSDHELLFADIIKREEEITTGIGGGIAIPHAKSAYCKKPGLAFARLNKSIDYNSLDNKPVNLIFMIITPVGNPNLHLSILAELSKKLIDSAFSKSLETVNDPEILINKL